MPAQLAIDLGDFENRAKELAIYDTKPFFNSRPFQASGFRLNSARGILEKSL
jgi:hypothetical protein